MAQKVQLNLTLMPLTVSGSRSVFRDATQQFMTVALVFCYSALLIPFQNTYSISQLSRTLVGQFAILEQKSALHKGFIKILRM